MEMRELVVEEKEKKEKQKTVGEKQVKREQRQFRLVLEKEAIGPLEQMLNLVNSGFSAGRVSKSDLATYLFKNAHRFLKKPEIIKIRNEFFDERVALEHLLNESEQSGRLPADLVKMLKDQHKASEDTV